MKSIPPPSLSLSGGRWIPATHLWHSWRSDVSSQSSSSALLLRPLHPPSVWENSWHPLMCDWPRTGSPSLLHLTGYLFMLFSGRWNYFLYGTMLQIPIIGLLYCFLTPKNDSSHLETKITEMLWLPFDTFLCTYRNYPQVVFRGKRIHQNHLFITRWNLYLSLPICCGIMRVYYNFSFIFIMFIMYITFHSTQHGNNYWSGQCLILNHSG